MEFKKIEQIAKMLKQYDLHKIYIESDNFKLEIQNGITSSVNLGCANDENINNKIHYINDIDEYIIKAPLIGIVSIRENESTCRKYTVGDKVKVGQVLCTIEAMKMFNEVICNEEGIIEKIIIEDNQFVEYDQILLKIRKNGEKSV